MEVRTERFGGGRRWQVTGDIGFRARLGKAYDEAVVTVRAALQEQGFGVITEIDVRATVKEKLGKDFRRYVILGACNPALAHRALSADPDVGLLLPCNVTVQEAGDEIVVTAVDPIQMLGVLQAEPAVKAVSVEAKTKL